MSSERKAFLVWSALVEERVDELKAQHYAGRDLRAKAVKDTMLHHPEEHKAMMEEVNQDRPAAKAHTDVILAREGVV